MRLSKGSSITADQWRAALATASTESEVIAVAAEFVAAFEPLEIALLPAACHPTRLRDANDLASYAYELMHYNGGSEGAQETLQLLRAFFSQAAARIAWLSAPGVKNPYRIFS